MKKLLLAAAVTTLSLNAAQAAPTLYGKLNVSIDNIDNTDFAGNDATELNSNSSRIGIKGEESLTDKISAIYLAEWQVNADGDGTDLGMRNRYLGIKAAGVGTLKAGQFDSYFKTSAGKYQDIFNDHNYLDITKTMHGEERLKNAIGFESDPKLLGGFSFNAMALFGENGETGYTTEKRDGIGDGISTSLNYDNKNIGLALAVAGNFAVPGDYNALSLSNVESDAYRVTGSYDFSKIGLNGFVLGGLWQHAELSDSPSAAQLEADGLNKYAASAEEESWVVATTYTIPNTKVALKAQYQSAVTTADAMEDRTIDQYGIGLDYNINKQTRVYGVVAQQKRDWKEDDKRTVIGAGMEFNF